MPTDDRLTADILRIGEAIGARRVIIEIGAPADAHDPATVRDA